MRFLVDAQLPPALARWLVVAGHEAEHVFDQRMEAASDEAIWTRATEIRAVNSANALVSSVLPTPARPRRGAVFIKLYSKQASVCSRRTSPKSSSAASTAVVQRMSGSMRAYAWTRRLRMPMIADQLASGRECVSPPSGERRPRRRSRALARAQRRASRPFRAPLDAAQTRSAQPIQSVDHVPQPNAVLRTHIEAPRY